MTREMYSLTSFSTQMSSVDDYNQSVPLPGTVLWVFDDGRPAPAPIPDEDVANGWTTTREDNWILPDGYLYEHHRTVKQEVNGATMFRSFSRFKFIGPVPVSLESMRLRRAHHKVNKKLFIDLKGWK